jgi:hypothetical protein
LAVFAAIRVRPRRARETGLCGPDIGVGVAMAIVATRPSKKTGGPSPARITQAVVTTHAVVLQQAPLLAICDGIEWRFLDGLARSGMAPLLARCDCIERRCLDGLVRGETARRLVWARDQPGAHCQDVARPLSRYVVAQRRSSDELKLTMYTVGCQLGVQLKGPPLIAGGHRIGYRPATDRKHVTVWRCSLSYSLQASKEPGRQAGGQQALHGTCR